MSTYIKISSNLVDYIKRKFENKTDIVFSELQNKEIILLLCIFEAGKFEILKERRLKYFDINTVHIIFQFRKMYYLDLHRIYLYYKNNNLPMGPTKLDLNFDKPLMHQIKIKAKYKPVYDSFIDYLMNKYFLDLYLFDAENYLHKKSTVKNTNDFYIKNMDICKTINNKLVKLSYLLRCYAMGYFNEEYFISKPTRREYYGRAPYRQLK